MSPTRSQSVRDRQEAERDEGERLAPWAQRSAKSRGRLHPEAEHAYRTAFARDRDRVVHSRAFRRLQYKTQVFVPHEGDHYRNRLTHTLEGSQIARTLARTLRLNENLAEAIVLAHDLGHTPFGHAGQGECQQQGDAAPHKECLQIRTVTSHPERWRATRGAPHGGRSAALRRAEGTIGPCRRHPACCSVPVPRMSTRAYSRP